MATPPTPPILSRDHVDYAQLSQSCILPPVVKMYLEAAIQQANAVAIVLALFAGALVSFAQIVNGVDPTVTDTNSRAWAALLVFLYSAIILSLGGSFLSLTIIKMSSDLPLAVQQRILAEESDSSKTFSTIARDGKIDGYFLANRARLLEHFGMSKTYRLLDLMSGFVLLAACLCTCAALTFWIFLSEPIVTAGVTVVFIGVTAIIVLLAYRFSTNGQGWS